MPEIGSHRERKLRRPAVVVHALALPPIAIIIALRLYHSEKI